MNTLIIDGLSYALPLLIIAIGGIYSERSGVINLALEGMLGFGAFCGGLTFMLLQTRLGFNLSAIYLSLLAAMAGGGIYALLHALLCIKFQANQVISGVVVNILSLALTGFLTSQINTALTGKPSDKFMLSIFPRISIPVLSRIPVLGGFFDNFYRI